MIKIALFGICGKMGESMLSELVLEEDIFIAAGFDKINIGTDIGVLTGRETVSYTHLTLPTILRV